MDIDEPPDNNPYFEFPSLSRSPPRRSSLHDPAEPSRERSSIAKRYTEEESSRESLSAVIKAAADHQGPQSVCVFDTNTLLSSTSFFTALFSLLLTLAQQSLELPSNEPASRPPMVILIPYRVVQELDGLKSTRSNGNGRSLARRQSVGRKAREATHALMDAMMRQKRASGPAGQAIPWHLHPMIAQTRPQNEAASFWDTDISVDDALVELCLETQKSSGLPVVFCSNDTNARLRAESAGVSTFDLTTVLLAAETFETKDSTRQAQTGDRSSKSSRWGPATSRQEAETRARWGPAMLLEQWSAQLGLEDPYSAEDAMAVDVNVGQERSPSPVSSQNTPQAGMSMTQSPPLSGQSMMAPDGHTEVPSSVQIVDQHFNQHQHHHQHRHEHDIPQAYPSFNRETTTHQHNTTRTTSATNSSRRDTPSTTHTGRSTADSVWAVRRCMKVKLSCSSGSFSLTLL
ncbi:unnamed protein product [Jaminaea pallidilutea]